MKTHLKEPQKSTEGAGKCIRNNHRKANREEKRRNKREGKQDGKLLGNCLLQVIHKPRTSTLQRRLPCLFVPNLWKTMSWSSCYNERTTVARSQTRDEKNDESTSDQKKMVRLPLKGRTREKREKREEGEIECVYRRICLVESNVSPVGRVG